MITDVLLSIFTYIASFIVSLLPAYTGLPAQVESALAWMIGLMNDIGGFIPLGTFLTILKLTIAIELGIMVFRFFAWLFKWNIHTPAHTTSV